VVTSAPKGLEMDLTAYREAKERLEEAQARYKREFLEPLKAQHEAALQQGQIICDIDALEATFQEERNRIEGEALVSFRDNGVKTIPATGGKINIAQSIEPVVVDEEAAVQYIGRAYPTLVPKLTGIKKTPFKKWWKGQYETVGEEIDGVEVEVKSTVRITLD